MKCLPTKSYGIHCRHLKWLITDRKQYVILNNFKSPLQYLTEIVPQQAVPGPLLFLLYVNDIVDNLNSISCIFADDTYICICFVQVIISK